MVEFQIEDEDEVVDQTAFWWRISRSLSQSRMALADAKGRAVNDWFLCSGMESME